MLLLPPLAIMSYLIVNRLFVLIFLQGAFLIPFLISSVVVGIPFALLEVSLGQWMKEGGIVAWNLTPLFKGIGYATLVVVFLGNIYYEVILAWSLRYLFASFSRDVPWKLCNQKWNTKCCHSLLTYTPDSPRLNTSNMNPAAQTNCSVMIDSTVEYWK